MSSPVHLPAPEILTRQLRVALTDFPSVQWRAQTTSTNAQLLAQGRQASTPRPWLLGAHAQQQGRGRAGRTWQNRAGAALMFSCAFDVRGGEDFPTRLLPALSPLAGVAACEALRHWVSPQMQHHLRLKWPNDVLWRGGKLAGILVETTGAGGGMVVMGLGLNLLDAPVLSQSLQRPIVDWCGVVQEDDHAGGVSVAQMVAGIARAWKKLVEPQALDLKNLPQRFAAVDALYGQTVDVLDQGRITQSGVACGVDDSGRLLLCNGSSQLLPVTVGDVSVRTRATWTDTP